MLVASLPKQNEVVYAYLNFSSLLLVKISTQNTLHHKIANTYIHIGGVKPRLQKPRYWVT